MDAAVLYAGAGAAVLYVGAAVLYVGAAVLYIDIVDGRQNIELNTSPEQYDYYAR